MNERKTNLINNNDLNVLFSAYFRNVDWDSDLWILPANEMIWWTICNSIFFL